MDFPKIHTQIADNLEKCFLLNNVDYSQADFTIGINGVPHKLFHFRHCYNWKY